jgi:arylformamidase
MENIRIYDITAVLSEELPVYGGGTDPGIVIKEHYSMTRGDRCNVSNVIFGNHTGTHADVPKHFIDDGLTCENVPLDHFIGPARVLDLRPFLTENRKLAQPADLEHFDIGAGEIILLNMGNSHLMRQSVFTRDYISVSLEAAEYLANKNVKTVGVDYLSIEASGSGTNPVHKALLGKGITILEGLVFDNDGEVLQGRYILSALPLKFKNGNGSPVRAVLADDFKLELVICDMDGLMLDTEPVSHNGWCEASKQMGFDMGEDLYRKMIGTNYNVCKQRMQNYLGYSFDFEEAYAIRSTYVRKQIDTNGVQVKKGLDVLLNRLDELNIKKCVATSTDYKRAKKLLTGIGVFKRFQHVIGGDNIKNGKPDPEIFLKAAELTGAAPKNCLVLEDSEAGAEAAYKAGMRTVLVPDMYAPNANTMAKVNAVCADLEEAAGLIGRFV